MTKFCPSCRQTKALEYFGANKARADGKQSTCKSCAVDATQNWRRGRANPAPTPQPRSEQQHG